MSKRTSLDLRWVWVLALCWGLPLGAQAKDDPNLQNLATAFLNPLTSPEAMTRLLNEVVKGRPTPPDQALAYFIMGEYAFGKSFFPKAAEFYQRVLTTVDPQSLDYLESVEERLAESYFNAQQYAQAERSWLALAAIPKTYLKGEAAHGLGQLAIVKGQWSEAQKIYQDLVQQYPMYQEREDVLTAFTQLDLWRKDLPSAIKRLREPESVQGQYFKGLVLYASEKYVEAANYFNRVVSSGSQGLPIYKNAFFKRGESFLEAGDYISAGKSIQSLLKAYPEKDPFTPYAKFKLAQIELHQGGVVKAQKLAEELLQDRRLPEEPLRSFLAECLVQQKRLDQAAAIYRDLMRSTVPEIRKNAWLKLGWHLYRQGHFEQAAPLFEQFVTQFPEDENFKLALYLKGQCALFWKRDPIAIQAFQALLPGKTLVSDLSLLRLQEIYQRNQQTEESIRVSEGYLRSGDQKVEDLNKPVRAWCWYRLAEAYLQRGDLGRSLEGYQRIVDEFWDSEAYPHALVGIMNTNFAMRNFEAMVKTGRIGVREKNLPGPVQQELQLKLAHALFNLKRYDEANATYLKWVEKNPRSPLMPEVRYVMGVGFIELKYYKNALESWRVIIRNFGKDPVCEKALLRTAEIYFEGQEFAKAAALFDQLVEDWPQSPKLNHALFKLGQAQLALEDYARAKAALAAFLNAFPKDPRASEAARDLELAAFKWAVKNDTLEGLNDFLKQFPQSQFVEKVQVAYGQHFYKRKQYAEAMLQLEAFLKAYPASPMVPQALFLMGECAERTKNSEKAKQYYQMLLQRPQGELEPEIMLRLASLYYEEKNYSQSMQLFKSVADKNPKADFAAQCLYNAATCLEQLGQTGPMLEAFDQLIKKYPKAPESKEAAYRLGTWNHENKQYAKAIEYLVFFNRAGGASVGSEINYRIGDSYENIKEIGKAVHYYIAAKNSKPLDEPFRIVALSQLAAIYEKQQNLEKAVGIYKDIAKHAQDPQWRVAAAERMKLIRRFLNGSRN